MYNTRSRLNKSSYRAKIGDNFCPPPPFPLFQGVRLGLEARGPRAAAREDERVTKMKGGGGGPETQFSENPPLPLD